MIWLFVLIYFIAGLPIARRSAQIILDDFTEVDRSVLALAALYWVGGLIFWPGGYIILFAIWIADMVLDEFNDGDETTS